MIPSGDYFLPKGTLLPPLKPPKTWFWNRHERHERCVCPIWHDGQNFHERWRYPQRSAQQRRIQNGWVEIQRNGVLPIFFLFERIKPMFLSAFASADMNPSSIKEGSIKSYEMEFYEISQNRGMTTDGLETIDFQVSVFDSIPTLSKCQNAGWKASKPVMPTTAKWRRW